MSGQEWDGTERRQPAIALEARVRNLEEDVRAGAKSRQAIHMRIGEINNTLKSMDNSMKSIADAAAKRNIDCLAHLNRTKVIEDRWTTIKTAFWKAPTFVAGVCAAAAIIWKTFSALVHLTQNSGGPK